MTEIASVDLADRGPGARLDALTRDDLAAQVRTWTRRPPAAAMLEVHSDAWHHAPELDDTEAPDHTEVEAGYQSLVAAVFGVNCPVVVSLDGDVSGLGLALVLAADVRVATPRTRLSTGGPLAALLGGASWLTARITGAGTFEQLAWTGGSLTAEEAHRRGLVTEIGDAAVAKALADRLAAAPQGSSALKRALHSRERRELATVLGYQAWLAEVAGSPRE